MKTNTLKQVLAVLLLEICVVSCNLKPTTLPGSQGRQGEVLVVINNHLWAGACGDSIRHYFSYPIMTLPAPEPMLTLLQQGELTNFMQKFHNIIMVTVDPGYEKATLGYKKNVYAKDQLIFNINAPSADSVIRCVAKNKDLIIDQFLTKDRDRYIEYFHKIADNSTIKKLQEKFQVDICIPKMFTLDVEKDNFVWLAREEGELVMGILIWKDPYTYKGLVDPDRLIVRMNEVTKQNVPGKTPDSYMADEPRAIPVFKTFMKDDNYCVQINGLWQMENGWMGGPYVNLSMVDAKRGQMITGVGFVYYPRKDKRQYLRELEAILYTMKPTEEKGTPAKE